MSWWRGSALPGIVALGAGAAAYAAACVLFPPSSASSSAAGAGDAGDALRAASSAVMEEETERRMEEEEEEEEEESLAVLGSAALLETSRSQTEAVSGLVETLGKLVEEEVELKRQLVDVLQGMSETKAMREEISELREALRKQQDFSSSVSSPAVGAPGKTGAEDGGEQEDTASARAVHFALESEGTDNDESAGVDTEAIRAALGELVRHEGGTEEVKAAAGMLSLYLKNLVDHPSTPRYHRLVKSNARFKKHIVPLGDRAVNLLTTVGFRNSAAAFDWEWHSRSGKDSASVETAIRTTVEQLSHVALYGVLPSEDPPVATTATSGDDSLLSDLPDPLNRSVPVSPCNSSFLVPPAQDSMVDGNMQPLPSPPLSSTAAGAMGSPAAAIAGTGSGGGGGTTPLADVSLSTLNLTDTSGIDAVHSPATKAPVADSSTAEPPPYPASFADVMKMVQSGNPPPGVQQLEHRISAEADRHRGTHTLDKIVAKPYSTNA